LFNDAVLSAEVADNRSVVPEYGIWIFENSLELSSYSESFWVFSVVCILIYRPIDSWVN